MRFRESLAYWRQFLGEAWPGAAICSALAEKFVAGVDVVDPLGLASIYGDGVMFLANHQTFLESLLFNIVVPPLVGRPTVAVAKTHHRDRWLGRLIDIFYGVADDRLPPAVEYFDRENPDSIVEVIDRVVHAVQHGNQNMMVHVEGTRRRSCRRGRVQAVSPLWAEVAVRHDLPIVPVRFTGGLPVEDPGYKHDAPVGFGQQRIFLGSPILPRDLRRLGDAERVVRVRNAINDLHDNRTEEPEPADPVFAAEVAERAAWHGVEPMHAAILVALLRFRDHGGSLDPINAAILRAADGGDLEVSDDGAPLARYLLGPGAFAAARLTRHAV